MSDSTCPACKAENDADAAYCDQCGQPLRPSERRPAPGADACPACGGVVENAPGNKGICSSCGLELVQVDDTPTAPSVDGTVVDRLIAAIQGRLRRQIPVDLAVQDSCREIFASAAEDSPSSPESDSSAVSVQMCPLCGAQNDGQPNQCGGCAISFGDLKAPQECPKCRKVSADDQCECGAVRTIEKLLEYAGKAVRFFCGRCKQPYTTANSVCPDCGGAMISAERFKSWAAGQSR